MANIQLNHVNKKSVDYVMEKLKTHEQKTHEVVKNCNYFRTNLFF